MPDRTPQNIRTLQIRLNQTQYDELLEEATREDRSMSSVARRRMFTPGSEVPIESRPTISNTAGHVRATFTSPDPDSWVKPQQETPIASDEATAVVTRTGPADKLNAKAALTKPVGSGKGGTHSPPKSIDQERLERMNAGKYGKKK